MTNEQQIKLRELAKEFAADPDVINAVKDIESRPLTTQNRYGDYMTFLTTFADNKIMLSIMAGALALAGGNREGISSALQIING